MTFLIVTLILLSASFYSVYYLNIRAQIPIDAFSDNPVINSFDVFKAKEDSKTNSEDIVESTPKDFAALLEEKRRAKNLAQEESRPSAKNLEPTGFNGAGLVEQESSVNNVLKESFFVVNHIFTYNPIFKSGEVGEKGFSSGAVIYLFVEMYNLQEDSTGEIDLAIDFKLKNMNDIIVPGYDAKDLVVYKGKPPYKDGYFLARMTVPLGSDFTPGKYYTDLLIKDKVAGNVRAEKYVFTIKEQAI